MAEDLRLWVLKKQLRSLTVEGNKEGTRQKDPNQQHQPYPPCSGLGSPVQFSPDELWLRTYQNPCIRADQIIESEYLRAFGHFAIPQDLTPQSPNPKIREAHRRKHGRAPGTFLVHRDDLGLWLLERRKPDLQTGSEKVWAQLSNFYLQDRTKLDDRLADLFVSNKLLAKDPNPHETAARIWLSELILGLPNKPKEHYERRTAEQRSIAKAHSVEYANANLFGAIARRVQESRTLDRTRDKFSIRAYGSRYSTARDLVHGIRFNHTAKYEYEKSDEEKLLRPLPIMSDNEDMDLFGDVDEDITNSPRREDSDREPDSGDDEGRNRSQRTQEREPTPDDYRVEEAGLVPHQVPAPIDGELNTLRVPDFLTIDPTPFDGARVTPLTVAETESRFEKAASTIRYKKNASGDLESNALFNRWSDGSVTISIGDVVYELMAKPLAPKIYKDYQDVLDSHTYLATPHVDSQLMQIVGHVNNTFTVVPNADLQAKAVAKLRETMAKSGRHNDHKDVANQIVRTEDPETQKRKAEQAERERNKLAKRKEQAAQRTEQRIRGPPTLGMGIAGSAGKVKRAPAKKARARRDDYDSEEEMERGRGRREDEYDMEDDFLAASDEEEEERGGDEDSEEEYEKNSPPRSKKQKKAAKGSDDDASEESDGGARVPSGSQADAGGRRKRQVIEDDEDDE